MSKRISLNLMPDAEAALTALVNKHGNWSYRTNTIVQAAIIAFNDMPVESINKYLWQVKRKDKRTYYMPDNV